MKVSSLIFFALALLLFSACEKDDSNVSDAALIEAIQQDANKQEVAAETLPDPSRDMLGRDFSESYVDRALLASGLGFEVNLRRRQGSRMGERARLYFNLDGRELRPDRNRERTRGEGGCDREECFALVFPVTYLMPDGSEITGDSEEAVGLAMRAWYADNPAAEARPELLYPVDIIFADGETGTLFSDEDLRRAYARCRGENTVVEECFNLVYPVTYLLPDGSEVTGDDKEAVNNALRTWYQNNPEAEDRPQLQYPVDIVYRDGATATVNSDEELRAAFSNCE